MLPQKEKELEKLDMVMIQNLRKIKQTQFQSVDFEAFETITKSDMLFSQLYMAYSQSGFFSSLITCPHMLGLQNKK